MGRLQDKVAVVTGGSRGIGEAISRQVLRAGADVGCEVGVLQASPMGHPLYEKMGFEEVIDYRQLVPSA